jgi:hypothetical protein
MYVWIRESACVCVGERAREWGRECVNEEMRHLALTKPPSHCLGITFTEAIPWLNGVTRQPFDSICHLWTLWKVKQVRVSREYYFGNAWPLQWSKPPNVSKKMSFRLCFTIRSVGYSTFWPRPSLHSLRKEEFDSNQAKKRMNARLRTIWNLGITGYVKEKRLLWRESRKIKRMSQWTYTCREL